MKLKVFEITDDSGAPSPLNCFTVGRGGSIEEGIPLLAFAREVDCPKDDSDGVFMIKSGEGAPSQSGGRIVCGAFSSNRTSTERDGLISGTFSAEKRPSTFATFWFRNPEIGCSPFRITFVISKKLLADDFGFSYIQSGLAFTPPGSAEVPSFAVFEIGARRFLVSGDSKNLKETLDHLVGLAQDLRAKSDASCWQKSRQKLEKFPSGSGGPPDSRVACWHDIDPHSLERRIGKRLSEGVFDPIDQEMLDALKIGQSDA